MGTAALFFGIIAIVCAMFGTPLCFSPLQLIALPTGMLAIGLSITQLSRSGWRKWNDKDPTCPYAVNYSWQGLGLGTLAVLWAILVITRDYGTLLKEYYRHY